MKEPIQLTLCSPRGFCAGVVRAIEIVNMALERHGPPVYVRHAIVHNRHVVETLRKKGAVFVEELAEIPDTDAPVIFSAHGVPRSVPAAAMARNLSAIDAICPLVTKVHREAERLHRSGRQILLIGHRGHPEVVGTVGQLPKGSVTLVESVTDVESLPFERDHALACVTQTTLSVDDTSEIIQSLKARFSDLVQPAVQDICYATTNRQAAVKKIAGESDVVFVVGSPNSSNSKRLVEVAQQAGCPKVFLIDDAEAIDWEQVTAHSRVGLSAGASAPEPLVQCVVKAFEARFEVTLREIETAREEVRFPMPKRLLESDRDRSRSVSD